jgi:hypothetical protein
MPRCAAASRSTATLIALAATLAALAPLPAAAQVQRNFPQKALRGVIEFGPPPDIHLNGQPARLAPGMRVHGMDNMLKMSGALIGSKFVVDYTVEGTGLIYEIWLLTPTEAAVQPWPQTPVQQATWGFDPIAQRWQIP